MKIKLILLSGMLLSNCCFAASGEASTAINNVSAKLFSELKKKEGNVFFSPYSIVTALAMVAEGARAKTAQEFKQFFHLDKLSDASFDSLHDSLYHLATDLIPFTADQNEINSKLDKLKQELENLRNPEGKKNNFGFPNVFYDPDAKQRKKEVELVNKINELSKQLAPYKFTQANAIWLDETITLREGYVNKLNKKYKLESVYNVDFKNENKETVKKINQWCYDNTNGKISSIVEQLPKVTKMVLANAIYFKGIWQNTFDKEHTKEESFYVGSKNTITAPMMHKRFNVGYAAFESDGKLFKTPKLYSADPSFIGYPGEGGYQVVELPYKGNKISMVVIVPMDTDGLERIESNLSYEMLSDAMAKISLARREVYLKLPKFKFETKYKLKDQLELIGLKRSFTDFANFSGISSTPLKISQVIHKAFVDVNEEGTEAAAVTAVIMKGITSVGSMVVPFVPMVEANRPFLFAIVHKESKSILFMGRVNNPKS